MKRFNVGEQVRIDIPDKDDPDFDDYHGQTGEIIKVIEDDAGLQTGDDRDSYLFVVELDNGDVGHFRWRDLRPDKPS